jgi:predicted nucleic acid-binding protein
MSYYFHAPTVSFHVDDAPVPDGSILISDALHASLMQSQSAGGRIAADASGMPIAVMPTDAEIAAGAAAKARNARNAALARSDWADLPNARLTDAQRAAWATYRADLFDWPAQPGWPDLALPTPPA